MRKKLVLALFLLTLSSLVFAKDVKDADLSGSWYSSNPKKLREEISGYLDDAVVPPPKGTVIALISPHAGIAYSGPCAAYAFSAVKDKDFETIVVMGFSHRRDYDGIAAFGFDGLRTPLGLAETDLDLLQSISSKSIHHR